jgi:hypothetical protein
MKIELEEFSAVNLIKSGSGGGRAAIENYRNSNIE